MGTVLEVTLVTRNEAAARDAIEEAFAYARRLESVLSRYDPESEVSRLNATAGSGPREVGPHTLELLRDAVLYAELTRGAFDVTVGPLVTLWVEAARNDRLPAPSELAEARLRVGAERIAIHPDGRVELPAPGMSVDLGGIAKGYALDGMVRRLGERGFRDALLSFGQSSTWASGSPPDHTGWRLLLRAPSGGFLGVLTLRDRALSVSSSLAQSSEIEGRRFGHVIDPRSGWPLTEEREAAVVARDAELAEVLSTALLILEPEDGLALVETLPRTEALLITGSRDRRQSSGWLEETRYQDVEEAGAEGGGSWGLGRGSP